MGLVLFVGAVTINECMCFPAFVIKWVTVSIEYFKNLLTKKYIVTIKITLKSGGGRDDRGVIEYVGILSSK